MEDIIDIRLIEKNIEQRKRAISNLRSGYVDCITIDDKFKVTVEPESKGQALEIHKEIKSLKRLNDADTTFMAKVREIAAKHGLTFNYSGTIAERPEKLCIHDLMGEAEKRLAQLQYDLKLGRAGMSYPAFTPEREEKLKSQIMEIGSQMEQMNKALEEISQLRATLYKVE